MGVPSSRGFPRLYAAASLKPGPLLGRARHRLRFPRLYAAASLKPLYARRRGGVGRVFSAALCRGLIEAPARLPKPSPRPNRFPRLYAAASLKRDRQLEPLHTGLGFPRLYAAASLKHERRELCGRVQGRFSAALCRGLIEAGYGFRIDPPRLMVVFRGFMPRPH